MYIQFASKCKQLISSILWLKLIALMQNIGMRCCGLHRSQWMPEVGKCFRCFWAISCDIVEKLGKAKTLDT